MAGLAAAKVDNGIGTAGTAYHCRWLPVKIDGPRNGFSTLNLYRGIKYAADRGCKVISVSFGSRIFARWEQEIINYALQKDVLIVAAAGNSGETGERIYPASYEGVLSVTHTDEDDKHLGGIRNKYIDICAPGANLPTTSFGDVYSATGGQSSFATPFAAGIAALLRGHFPDYNYLQISELIKKSADPVYHIPLNAPYVGLLGSGRINAESAIKGADNYTAVRMTSSVYSDRFGNYAFRGDTLSLELEFTNLLRPTSAGLTAKITSGSPFVIIPGDSLKINIGALSRLRKKSVKVQVILSENLPASAPLEFRIDYEDGFYRDLQYFTIFSSPNYLKFDFNDFSLTAGAAGRFGNRLEIADDPAAEPHSFFA